MVAWSGRLLSYSGILKLDEAALSHCIQIDEDLFQSPSVGATTIEPADLVNHSCNPNCGIRGQISMVAMRDIQPGEEITYDYAMSDGVPFDEFSCACGALSCRGKITGNDWKLTHLWEKYEGYFATYLQRRIENLKLAGNSTSDMQ